jgi:hypothetical protein
MRPTLAVVLFLLGAAIAVLGGWLRRPARLRDRGVAWLFAIVLVVASPIVYLTTDPGPVTETSGTVLPAATTSARGSATPNQAAPASATQTVSNAPASPQDHAAATKGPTPRTSSAATAPPTQLVSPYVSADRFVRFGASQGAFVMQATGSMLDITVPNRDMSSQWGGELRDHFGCATTVEFDVRVEAGAVDYYGFAVLPRGSIVNDRANGSGIGFYQESDGLFIAALAALPQQPLGGQGGGSYPVADLRTRRHVVVAASGGTHTVTVDGTPAGDYADVGSECGAPIFAAWGGVTVHIDHVLIH